MKKLAKVLLGVLIMFIIYNGIDHIIPIINVPAKVFYMLDIAIKIPPIALMSVATFVWWLIIDFSEI